MRYGELTMTEAERKFREFHSENPNVYDELVRLAREAKKAGKTKAGLKMLWEVLRWRIWLETTGDDFKLNNNYTSRYARLIMESEAGLEGFFEVRGLKT